MEFCTNEWIRIGKDHSNLESKYNVAAFSKNEVIEVTGCPEKQEEVETSETTLGKVAKDSLCDVIKMAKIPKK